MEIDRKDQLCTEIADSLKKVSFPVSKLKLEAIRIEKLEYIAADIKSMLREIVAVYKRKSPGNEAALEKMCHDGVIYVDEAIKAPNSLLSFTLSQIQEYDPKQVVEQCRSVYNTVLCSGGEALQDIKLLLVEQLKFPSTQIKYWLLNDQPFRLISKNTLSFNNKKM